MRIYYQGPEAVVTSELFIRRGSSPGTFMIRDLRNVCIAPDVADGTGAVLVSAAAAFAAAVVIYGIGGPWFALGFLAITTAGGACAVPLRRRRPRRHELRADYRGAAVSLFSCPDPRVFNQVSRALRRAIENLPPPSSWHDGEAA